MDRPAPSTHRVDTGADGAPILVKRATDEAGRARLRTEATVLQALSHPGVAQVLAVIDDDEAVELHLAWVGSHTLATVIGLGPAAAAEVVAALAATVADVHDAGLVHRRVSPDHVVLGPGGRPVLTGFADAVRADRADRADDVAALGALLTGLVAPTPDAMALPDRRRDQWGERWWGSSSRRDRGLRGALLTLADRAQADDPAIRPPAAELASLLRATAGLDPEGPGPRPTPPSAPARRRRSGRSDRGHRRRPAVVALGLCVSLAALAALIVRAGGGDPVAGPPATIAAPPILPSAAPLPPPDPPPVSSPPPTSLPAPTEPACPHAPTGGHDVDGDGCPDAVRVAGERVSVGSTTWLVGRAGDRAAVGDWDCDGMATVAVLRPATGEVFVYDRWVEPGDALTVGPVTRVDGADGIEAGDGDGCPVLTLTGPGGLRVTVPPGGDG